MVSKRTRVWVQVDTYRNRWWLLTGWPSLFPFLFFSVCTVKRSRTRENNTTPEGYQPWRATNRDRRDEGSLVFRLNATCFSFSFYFHTVCSCFYSLLPFFLFSFHSLFIFFLLTRNVGSASFLSGSEHALLVPSSIFCETCNILRLTFLIGNGFLTRLVIISSFMLVRRWWKILRLIKN